PRCGGRRRFQALAISATAAATVILGGCQVTPAATRATAATSAGGPAIASPPAGAVADCLTHAPPTCYAPRQFRVAYGIQPLLDRGINGRGETIVMPEFAS